LPITTVDKWYHAFIDSHTFGTEDEKDALKETSPYEIEWHGTVPIYRMSTAMIELMLLDFGTIGLKATAHTAENCYRPAQLIPEPDVEGSVAEVNPHSNVGVSPILISTPRTFLGWWHMRSGNDTIAAHLPLSGMHLPSLRLRS
jgi:hypothetical protein